MHLQILHLQLSMVGRIKVSFFYRLYLEIPVKHVRGCLSKLFFEKPIDYSIKVPCKACGEFLKANKSNSTTLKTHAMRKHSTIWNYLSCKRDGKQFAVGEAGALPTL